MAKKSREDRFWEKVDKSGECWLWVAAMNTHGYGNFRYQGETQGAHKISYILEIGEVPKGFYVDHMCHTRACVRPSHLRLTTNKQNGENRSALQTNNTSGYQGVSLVKSTGKWRAAIKHHGKVYCLGSAFLTAEAAAEVAKAKRLELFTHNENDRRKSSILNMA